MDLNCTLKDFINNFIDIFENFQIKDIKEETNKCLSSVSYLEGCSRDFRQEINYYQNCKVKKISSDIGADRNSFILIYIEV